ncbi:hypothetical protein CIPAW_01G278300 [Carya illinoinensis]|uniref:Uncharacterized protein n=1 Tax=Carya illinoinensis TaxID=32201 RepID=A0A8T1RSL6_CARIL|nr:hypothetical protein CIPAW_01G278300 [Carya illinoinensis]
MGVKLFPDLLPWLYIWITYLIVGMLPVWELTMSGMIPGCEWRLYGTVGQCFCELNANLFGSRGMTKAAFRDITSS